MDSHPYIKETTVAITDNGSPVVVAPNTSFTDHRPSNFRSGNLITQVEYVNFTETDIYVKTQNNLPFVVPPENNMVNAAEHRPHLEIKITYTLYGQGAIVGCLKLLNSLVIANMLHGDEAAKLHEQLNASCNHHGYSRSKTEFKFVIFKRVFDDDINRHQLVMIRECNVVATHKQNLIIDPHPYSNEGLQQVDVATNKLYQAQAGVFVRVIDNECLATTRFFYAGRQLIAVPSSLDPTKESGVYCTISTMARDGQVTPRTDFMSFEDAQEEIGLYRSQDDAITYGDPEKRMRLEEQRDKLEIKRLNREMADAVHQHQARTLEMESLMSEQKLEIERLRHDNLRFKEEADFRKTVRDHETDTAKKQREDYYDTKSSERKDHYEERSHQRKDWTEILKYVPALIIGALGAFAVVRTATAGIAALPTLASLAVAAGSAIVGGAKRLFSGFCSCFA